jgi:hypothetical protein
MNALQKVFNEAYVPQDITHDSKKHLIGRIQATPTTLTLLMMSLILKRTDHNKSLYITIKCKDCVIAKVLIDNGFALNGC